MSVKYLAGLAVICGLTVGGLDYYQQSQASDDGLTAQAYIASVKSRIGIADMSAVADTRSFLPTAPEGWTRQAPSNGAGAHVWGEVGGDADKHGWVYTSGADVVWVAAFRNALETSEGVLGGMAEISAAKIAPQPDYLGYAVVGGVGFGELQAPSGQDPAGVRTIDGWVGFDDEIQIRVRTNASDETVMSLLGAIDYDGLNGQLAEPVPSIGAGTQVPPEHEARMAAEIIELRKSMIGFRADAAIDRTLNADDQIRLLNSLVEGIAPDATLDATQGDAPDFDALIQSTYRTALALILASEGPVIPAVANPVKLTCSKTGISTRCRPGG